MFKLRVTPASRDAERRAAAALNGVSARTSRSRIDRKILTLNLSDIGLPAVLLLLQLSAGVRPKTA